ncbi:MAG: 2-iminoacetate synthase ThiH [Victivallales bacterium]
MLQYSDIDEKTARNRLETVSADDVRISLGNDRISSADFMNLISPAALPFLPQMREKAAILKKMCFGKTVRLYMPLYVSSYCINNCLYCGFRTASHSERRRLSQHEVLKDAKVIKSHGIDSLLLVTGEDPEFISVEFLSRTVRELKKTFSYVSLEIYPMDVEGYRELFNAGAHGLTIYQETYNRKLYRELHLSGPKRDYDYRLDAPARAARAGFYNIGIGALLGLYDWRIEAVSIAAHAIWLKKHFWKSRIQFSFPRITPIEGDFKVPSPVSDAELEQMMLSFRMLFPEGDILISTREKREFRSRAVLSSANIMSAGSSVVPGGYSSPEKKVLGQFNRRDTRTVRQVENDLKKLGLEAVFKDWDRCLGV